MIYLSKCSHFFLVLCLSEDLEHLELGDMGDEEAQKFQTGPKFNYASPITVDNVRIITIFASDVHLID